MSGTALAPSCVCARCAVTIQVIHSLLCLPLHLLSLSHVFHVPLFVCFRHAPRSFHYLLSRSFTNPCVSRCAALPPFVLLSSMCLLCCNNSGHPPTLVSATALATREGLGSPRDPSPNTLPGPSRASSTYMSSWVAAGEYRAHDQVCRVRCRAQGQMLVGGSQDKGQAHRVMGRARAQDEVCRVGCEAQGLA